MLTTAATSALPGLSHGGDPEVFMPASAFAAYLQTYAQTAGVPLICGVEVTKVEPSARGYRVIVKDSMLSVPGGITLARDGYLYVTVNRSLRAVEAPKSEAAANPYALVRYKPAIVAGQ